LTTRKRASSGEGTFAPQIAPAPRRADSGFRRNDNKKPGHPMFATPAKAGVQFKAFKNKGFQPAMSRQ
jgi:hypothetical protein